MQIKRTNSIIQGPNNEVINVSFDGPVPQAHSQNAFSMVLRNRRRVPTFLQSTLRGKNSEIKSNAVEEEGQMKQSRLGNAIKSSIKNAMSNLKDQKFCEVCESEIKVPKNKNLEVYMCECEHKFNFCESCLHHYVIFKVKTFEQVHCPREGCPAILDMNTNFFKQLPIDIQKAYRKLHLFYETSKDPNLKLCPKENCEGVLRTTMEMVMVCSVCENSFCPKCLLGVHEGECDSQQIKFFQSNLHYRQCKKCKFIIEKNQGCNHMTCRCGNQFCYVCGSPWNPAHYGNHDQNGQLIVVPGVDGGNAAAANNPAAAYNDDACCDCGCIDECCGGCCGCIIKAPIKLILVILFIFLMMIIFVSRDLLIIFGMLVVTIFAGMFGFSFERLCELQGCSFALALTFFPVMMIYGIGVAFRQIFCDVIPDLCSQYWQMFGDGLTGICQI